jgi:hypothetical protein
MGLLMKAVLLLAVFQFAVCADPTTHPLLGESDMMYLGYFNVPRPATGEAARSFDYGGSALAVSEDGQTLYAGGHVYNHAVGRVAIPRNLGTTAELIQAPARVAVDFGHPSSGTESVSGALVYNGRLIVQKRNYYDTDGGANSHTAGDLNVSNFCASTRLANLPSVQFGNGYMGHIPLEWQALFGGPAFAGNSCMSIIGKCSNGPSFYVFDPDDVGVTSPVPSIPLMYYNTTHPLVEDPDAANDIWIRADTKNSGIIFASGTRSVLFVSRHGYGPRKYKVDDGCGGGGGESAAPYRRQVTAFDANDLLAVKNGTKQPWEIRPYAWWELPGPKSTCASMAYSGLAYDDVTRRVYIAFPFSTNPRVHVYQIRGNSNPVNTINSKKINDNIRLIIPGSASSGPVKMSVRSGKSGPFSLGIYDISGRLIWDHRGSVSGIQNISWNSNCANGLYMVRLFVDGTAVQTKKIMVR